MHHRIKMSYLEPILVHPVRRQNFGDGVAQTCNPHLIPCHKSDDESDDESDDKSDDESDDENDDETDDETDDESDR